MTSSTDRMSAWASRARSLAEKIPIYPADTVTFKRKVGGLCDACLDKEELNKGLQSRVLVEDIRELRQALVSLRQASEGRFNFDDSGATRIRRDLEAVAAILEDCSSALTNAAPLAIQGDVPSDAQGQYGPWHLGQPLGRGGQGIAHLATNRQTGQLGVLKILRREKGDPGRAKAFDRFRHELRGLLTVRHPCVLSILDSNLDAEEPWLVTEYMALGSLDDSLKALRGDVWRTLRIARDIASALRAVHEENIIHRDVKPKNILLRTLDHAVLGDFGIAHIREATELTSTDEKVSPYWFGPPEAEGGRLDAPPPNFDVYSLGKVVYVCLSGGERFQREAFRSEEADLVKRLSQPALEAVNQLLDHMIVPEPAGRFQRMTDVIQQIDETLSQLLGCRSSDQCRVCHSDRYQSPSATDLSVLGISGVTVSYGGFSHGATAEVCPTCGDIRLSAPRIRESWAKQRGCS